MKRILHKKKSHLHPTTRIPNSSLLLVIHFHFSKKIERHFSTEGDITVSRLLEFETFVISLKVLVSKNLFRVDSGLKEFCLKRLFHHYFPLEQIYQASKLL